MPLKETTSTLHQDSRIPGRDRTPDVQNTKQNTTLQRLVIYSCKQSMYRKVHVDVRGRIPPYLNWFKKKSYCASVQGARPTVRCLCNNLGSPSNSGPLLEIHIARWITKETMNHRSAYIYCGGVGHALSCYPNM